MTSSTSVNGVLPKLVGTGRLFRGPVSKVGTWIQAGLLERTTLATGPRVLATEHLSAAVATHPHSQPPNWLSSLRQRMKFGVELLLWRMLG